MRVHHFYHVWADGFWNLPATGHVAAIRDSGFTPDRITVGLVGSEVNQEGARAWFRAELSDVAPVDFIGASEGYEQVTLAEIRRRALAGNDEAAVVYAHGKGAYNISCVTAAHRKFMTKYVIRGWQDALRALDDYDAAGCFWAGPDHAQRPPYSHFVGNFWWARASYIRTLPVPATESRHDAEAWLGLNAPRVHDLFPYIAYPDFTGIYLAGGDYGA